MKELIAYWRSGNPLALVGVYAAGVAITIGWIGLLPGEPRYEGPGRSLEVAVALSALVIGACDGEEADDGRGSIRRPGAGNGESPLAAAGERADGQGDPERGPAPRLVQPKR